MTLLFALAVVGAVGAAASLVFWATRPPATTSQQPAQPEFSHPPIMSGVELQLFRQINALYPYSWLFPQVSMAALVTPTVKKRQNRDAFWLSLNKVVQKRVDFALFSSNMTLIAVIELDDGSHDKARLKAKDAARDALLASAGVPVVRFDVRQWPDDQALKAALAPHLGPKAR